MTQIMLPRELQLTCSRIATAARARHERAGPMAKARSILASTEALPPPGLAAAVPGGWGGLRRAPGLDPPPKVRVRVVRDDVAQSEECARARHAIEAAAAVFPAHGPGERSLAPVGNLGALAVTAEMEELLGGPQVGGGAGISSVSAANAANAANAATASPYRRRPPILFAGGTTHRGFS